MEIPPGIRFLARVLPTLAAPPTLVFCILRLFQFYQAFAIPTWATILACVIAQPALAIASAYYTRHSDRADAAARGADLISEVHDRWPGGVSIIATIVRGLQSGYPGDVFEAWWREYGGTYFLRVLFENRIVTVEPEYIKTILALQFDNFQKGSTLFSQLRSLLGAGVFNSDGDMWKFHRAMTRPFFKRERISDFDIFSSRVDDALTQAKHRLSEGYPIDFQDLVSRFTLDSATEFLFRNDVRSLSAGLAYPHTAPQARMQASFSSHPSNVFFNAFATSQHLSVLRILRGPGWPLFEFWEDKVKPHREVVDAFIEPIMLEALAKKKYSLERGEEESTTLLDHLVQHTDDTTILKDELVNLLVASRDTIASSLTFAIYMMAEHPRIAQRLREEVLTVVGASERPTYDHIRRLKYLRAFIDETLRLYPPVPVNSRISGEATVWPAKMPGGRPIYVPAKTTTVYSVIVTHRRTDLWGPDALVFDPDRFLDERLHKYLIPNPFIFLPFNAGPRICLGQQFAYHEMSFFLIRLLQRFSGFTLALDAQPPESRPPESWKSECAGLKGRDKIWPGAHLTMYVKGGLWVRMNDLGVDTESA